MRGSMLIAASAAAALAPAGSEAFIRGRSGGKSTDTAKKADKYVAEQNARMAKPQKTALLTPCTKETSRAARRNRARKSAKKAAAEQI